jgi:hypothetical protein
VIDAVVGDEASIRQSGGNGSPLFDRLHSVASAMQHEAGRRDVAQHVGYVDIVDGLARARDVPWRNYSAHILGV